MFKLFEALGFTLILIIGDIYLLADFYYTGILILGLAFCYAIRDPNAVSVDVDYPGW